MKNFFLNESKIITTLTFENRPSYFIAVDEVGRGAGAGPVVVCTSLWTSAEKKGRIQPAWLPLIDDSKKLTPEEREECFALICKDYQISEDNFCPILTECNADFDFMNSLGKPNKIFKLSQTELRKIKLKSQGDAVFDYCECVCFSLGSASNLEIDQINIWNAIQVATNRALLKLKEKMNVLGSIDSFEHAVLFLDGHMAFKMLNDFVQIPQITIVEGDSLLKTIGFSSILAKVSRDRYMIALKEEFPHIGFEQHKGYLTQKHQVNLKLFGHTRFHRQSFLKNFDSM